MSDDWKMAHDARVRTCIVIAYGMPVSELRDDIRCPACDELHTLMHHDPDVLEILTREEWCEACKAGDKPAPVRDTNQPDRSQSRPGMLR